MRIYFEQQISFGAKVMDLTDKKLIQQFLKEQGL